MSKRVSKEDIEIDVNQDVEQLADTLDDLLKSYGSKTKDEIDNARAQAETLLKKTRARLSSSNKRVTQAAKEAGEQVDSYVRDNPWYGVGIGAALGVFIGALLTTTTRSRR